MIKELKEYNRKYYKENRERELERSKEYRKKHKEERKEYFRKWYEENEEFRLQPLRIYNKLKSRLKHGNHRGDTGKKLDIMPEDTFLEWDTYPNRKCYYCGLSEKDLWVVKKITDDRLLHIPKKMINSKRLQLERKDCAIGYIKDNLVWACPICNSIKKNFFTAEEWLKIAQKFIKPLWKKQIDLH